MNDYFDEWAAIENHKPIDALQARMLNAIRVQTTEGKSTHTNYLMDITGLNWQQANNKLNGLVLRGLITKDGHNYKTKH